MKGVVLPGDRKVDIRDFPEPAPGPGEVVLDRFSTSDAVYFIVSGTARVVHYVADHQEITIALREFEHLSYDSAGHGIGRPFTSTMEINATHHPLTGRLLPLGGTPAGTAHAREDSWQHLLAFLDANLRR